MTGVCVCVSNHAGPVAAGQTRPALPLCVRIVVYGQTFLKSVRPYSAKVFQINKEFKLPIGSVCPVLLLSPKTCFSSEWLLCGLPGAAAQRPLPH